MEKLELDNKLKELEESYEHNKKMLIMEYCMSNNPYKVGDKFTDHIGTIIIESIKYSSVSLCCVYLGLELKKDGIPRKDRARRKAYQINDITKNK